MLRSRRLSYLLAVATIWLPLYFVMFMAFIIAVVFSTVTRGDQGALPGILSAPDGAISPVVLAELLVHLLTIVLSIGLLVVYLLDVFRNPDLVYKQDERILWVVLLVFAGVFTMPVYWWLYLRPGGESFRRRTVN